ncbi:hypothetical protein USDA257_c04830 [Sinorhizobium fredii USDA 257]|uniref:Uncharacterized protein n=1 Tax=Sinorhizobium fredii (strain USDA 257) TaxID=1185652 RepID=I3WZM3_SINF2|nr:hypothetical protein USDA257_c04830 [Sinorhizobium fredii USDA 257]
MCGIPPAAGLDGGCLNRNQVRCKSISFKMPSKKLRASPPPSHAL